jgi:hypothetical protein
MFQQLVSLADIPWPHHPKTETLRLGPHGILLEIKRKVIENHGLDAGGQSHRSRSRHQRTIWKDGDGGDVLVGGSRLPRQGTKRDNDDEKEE